ncbi:hypothetical protein MKS88_000788 [Plasmodium brasilianum]|uniref:Uncharacterized protein n=1 Tax=Plasmodium brasilianum TaxID=5824 RepID=A0ACB9YGJ2_PLABR|nr:hypothetical protein MKS88_000788 [Plasmodium brasilianum]
MNFNTVYLKEDIPNFQNNEKEYISNNEKGKKGKNIQLNGSLLNNAGEQKKGKKNNSYIFGAKGYSLFEETSFQKSHYLNFLKKNTITKHEFLRNVKHRKYRKLVIKSILFVLSLFILHLLHIMK